ncbi:MAG: hypothetical protein K0S70_817 [Microbacterium sp.]|jgi:hypothetical protein|nr:hypothetical protein [Microbacterium sp.]
MSAFMCGRSASDADRAVVAAFARHLAGQDPEPRPAVRETPCPECDGTVRVGDLIVPDDGDVYGGAWRHATCPPGRFDLVREVCSECFTERSTSGACLCEEAS